MSFLITTSKLFFSNNKYSFMLLIVSTYDKLIYGSSLLLKFTPSSSKTYHFYFYSEVVMDDPKVDIFFVKPLGYDNSNRIATYKGKYIKIKYVSQLPDTQVPTFVFFANLPQYIKQPYMRFLENKLRENWEFTGTPILLFPRQK